MILDFFPENALGDGPKNSRIRVNGPFWHIRCGIFVHIRACDLSEDISFIAILEVVLSLRFRTHARKIEFWRHLHFLQYESNVAQDDNFPDFLILKPLSSRLNHSE